MERVTQIHCNSILEGECCLDKLQEMIPLIIYNPEKDEWQMVRSCCLHYHEIKKIHDRNLELGRKIFETNKNSTRVITKRTYRKHSVTENLSIDDLLNDY